MINGYKIQMVPSPVNSAFEHVNVLGAEFCYSSNVFAALGYYDSMKAKSIFMDVLKGRLLGAVQQIFPDEECSAGIYLDLLLSYP